MFDHPAPASGGHIQSEFRNKPMRKIISFMHISLDGFVERPNGEMNWIKVDEEIYDYVGKPISEGDTVPVAGCSLSPAGGGSTSI